MSTIASRIKELRKENNLSQAKFGKKIGISRDSVNNIEQNRNKKGVPDNIIRLIAITFNVDETWLRTGEGTKLKQLNRKEEITKAVENLLTNEKNSFKERLISVLICLNESQWEVLANIAERIVTDKADDNNNELATTKEKDEISSESTDIPLEKMIEEANKWETLIEKKQMSLASQKQSDNCEKMA